MEENKIVTYEMFKRYHELLMRYIENGDGIDLDDIISDDEEVTEEEG